MKEKKVYIRDYKGKEYKKCDEVINIIKKDNHENIISIDPYKKDYWGHDINFLTIISIDKITNGYDKPHTTVKISVEKIGSDLTKLSEIENLLIKEGFKEEILNK